MGEEFNWKPGMWTLDGRRNVHGFDYYVFSRTENKGTYHWRSGYQYAIPVEDFWGHPTPVIRYCGRGPCCMMDGHEGRCSV